MSTAETRRRVVMVDTVPMSALVAGPSDASAAIVAIHGGATSSTYFDCPGHPELSLVRQAADAGYLAIALDRPGYGASAMYQDTMDDPAARVCLAWGAVRKIAPDAPVFILAHSLGCELALRMALDRDVRGLSLAGTGLTFQPAAQDILSQATLTRRPAGLRELLWEPTECYPPEVLTGALAAPGVAYEGKITANWPGLDFPELAAGIDVPVQFSAAQHEAVWDSSPAALAAIAALFTAAPQVTTNEIADSGHNLSAGLAAGDYHRSVLDFANECMDTENEREAG
ncbi:MAG: alpha/beta fold hydrolase [Mycobacterium sp.]|nr:alpha/beta fold hydrolase [Mycobacterium sp.]